ncbi:hypothetical protein OEZ85_002179 [Tetradesmus obliquus]|uniref:Uncharacterized protein n=1 Tax=Tetradesmus obliquus TaxID=3088 RepID=A0ABY8U518_TETOB|nr:hypothetical protein OEZ85_002179 [Tetradesmus obliquus]
MFLLDQQALTASVQQASAPPCLARPARKQRTAAPQQQLSSSHAEPALPQQQQQQHVQQEPTFIPMQLMQTVALLLCTRGAALLPGMQLIAAGLVVPCIIVLQVEAAARQAFLSGGLTQAESAATGGNGSAGVAGAANAKRLGFWGSSIMRPVPVAKAAAAAAAQPACCGAGGCAVEGGTGGSACSSC